jgi:hypothetical protein
MRTPTPKDFGHAAPRPRLSIEEMLAAKNTQPIHPGAEVLMADGTTKPIEEVEIGDKVLATDPETGRTVARMVTAEIIGEGSKKLVEVTVKTLTGEGKRHSVITATDGHPFWVTERGEWIDAADLKAGQHLRTDSGSLAEIMSVKHRTAQARVHNLTVADLHTYCVLAGATPILVHNCNDDVAKIATHVEPRHIEGGHLVDETSSLFDDHVDLENLAAQSNRFVGKYCKSSRFHRAGRNGSANEDIHRHT